MGDGSRQKQKRLRKRGLARKHRFLAVVGVQALTVDDDNPSNSRKRGKKSSQPDTEKIIFPKPVDDESKQTQNPAIRK
jgi:hypothetical protein